MYRSDPKHNEKIRCQRIQTLKGIDADVAICETIPVTFEYWREVTEILEMDMPKRGKGLANWTIARTLELTEVVKSTEDAGEPLAIQTDVSDPAAERGSHRYDRTGSELIRTSDH